MRGGFGGYEKMEEKLGMDDTYMAVYIRKILDQHIQTYLDCKNGIGTFPDFIGAVLVNELDTCIGLSEQKKERDKQRMQEWNKKVAEEARMQAETEVIKRTEELASAKDILLHGGIISDAKQICSLADAYKVNIPLRTRGWILNSLVSCGIVNGQVSIRYKTSGRGKGSTKVFDVIYEIREAIKTNASGIEKSLST